MKTPLQLVLVGMLGAVFLQTVSVWGEELSKTGPTAFRLHREGMNTAQVADFNYGRGLFNHSWKPIEFGDGSTSGFGPLYNANSCVACHIRDGRGRPPEEGRTDAISFILRLSAGSEKNDGFFRVLPDPTYGFQFQDNGIAGVPAEGEIFVSYEEIQVVLADDSVVWLRKPNYQLKNLGYGPVSENLKLGPRIAPQLIGLGLLENIPVSRLEELEDIDDSDNDGISGVINWSLPDAFGQRIPGRFGWKLTTSSVREQSDNAANGDMGFSTSLISQMAGDCTILQEACLSSARDAHLGQSIELSDGDMRLLAFYAANLNVPDRRNQNSSEVLLGRDLFSNAGCMACHVAEHSLETGEVIAPFTDLLLHDMGPGLADGIEVGYASASEWRTAPLWGIGLTQIVSGHTYFLHDGRARNLTEAILWHGGEAESSRVMFEKMDAIDRANLISFVNSL